MKNNPTIHAVVFQMPDHFTVNDVVSRVEDDPDLDLERSRDEISVFLERLVALGILRQKREHYSFTAL
ncbi:MAG: hypothetical protein ACRD8U_19300 [Pyrinomonadaceae bacterium]